MEQADKFNPHHPASQRLLNAQSASACAARPKHAILTWLACLWRKCSLETAPNLSAMPSPAIIFLDELDAIGTNQLGRFSSDERIKVIAATNHIDILDPALLRSGRLGRKIEFPQPNDMARARILEIHSRKMAVSEDVNYEELAPSTTEGGLCRGWNDWASGGATKLGH